MGRRGTAIILILAAAAMVIYVGAARAVAPTIVAPVDGTDVPAGWTGPVEVTWQEAGDVKIEVTGPQPTQAIADTIAPENVGVSVQYPIAALDAPGSYVITASRSDGTEASSVTVRVPPPNDVSIIAPSDGSTVVQGWHGPIKVRWDSFDPTGTYGVLLDGTELCSYDGATLTLGGTTNCSFSTAPSVGGHGLTVEETGDGIITSSNFTVSPHLSLGVSIASPWSTFYPYVREGYRDRVTVHWNLNKQARIQITVRNSSGRTVRRASLGVRGDGNWEWNGRNRGGSLVPTGAYSIGVHASAMGETRNGSRSVRVARGWRTKHASKTRCGGCGPGAYDYSAGCAVGFDIVQSGDIYLVCNGGDFAVVAWRFRIPSTAYNLSHRIIGEVGCCSPGAVVRDSERSNRRTYIVGAGVGGFRSYWIAGVRIKYSYKVRI
jgi:Flagellar hook capping protein